MRKITENPFKSFWMAGFECSDQLNTHGERVDFLYITNHLEQLEEDYERIRELNMSVVREGVRWSQVEKKPYVYDFTVFEKMIEIGKYKGIQQIWDLCHFGFPDDLTPLHPHFTKRFVAFCIAFAKCYKSCNPEGQLIVTPVNEVSFISWLGGDVASTSPYCLHNGWQVKYAYMKAYIAGVSALKNIDPGIRIMTTEPLINIAAPLDATEQQIIDAAGHNESQFQTLDMLCGRICPELGGKEEFLDIVGFNYYYNNQWIDHPYQVLGWNDAVAHVRYIPVSELLYKAYLRYNRPIVLSETSHPKEHRPIWIDYIASEISTLLLQQIPIWGICLYPVIDRPDWDNLNDWHHAGIWDCYENVPGKNRIPHGPSIQALGQAQRRTAQAMQKSEVKHNEVVI